MALRFNRYLRGVLSYLDAKVQGRQPALLGDELRGVIDMTRFADWGQIELQFNTLILVTSVQFIASSIGPIQPGERRYLLSHSLTAAGQLVTAGDQADFCTCIKRASPSSITYQLTGQREEFVQNDAPAVYAKSLPTMLLPGDQLGIWVHRAIVGAGNLNLTEVALSVRILD